MLGYEGGKMFSSSKGKRCKLTKVVAWRRVHCTGNEDDTGRGTTSETYGARTAWAKRLEGKEETES